MLQRIAVAMIFAGVATNAVAQTVSECSGLESTTTLTFETYYNVDYSGDNPLCSQGVSRCRLHGVLYVPLGASHAPALVFSHGRGRTPTVETLFCNAVSYFTSHGFVVFVAFRRGVEPESVNPHLQFTNTGRYYEDVVDDARRLFEDWPPEAVPYVQTCAMTNVLTNASIDCLNAELIRAGTREIGLAVRWLKDQPTTSSPSGPLVDPEKVVLLGHSNGSKLSILSAIDLHNERKPNAVLSLSLDESGWGNNAYFEEMLFDAVANITVPVALLQPANAEAIESTRQFGQTLARNRKRYLAQIFPALTPPEGMAVHEAFPELQESVDRWAPVARLFLKIYGVEPGQ